MHGYAIRCQSVSGMSLRLGILAMGLAIFAFLHTLLAADGVRRRLELLTGLRVYRLLYNLAAAAALFALFAVTHGDYPLVWDARGAAKLALHMLQVGAVVLSLGVLQALDLAHFAGVRQLRGDLEPRRGLQTQGVYAICRHPLYLSTCVFFSAWPRMDLRWLLVALWLWAYAVIGSIFEERKLAARFGAAYGRYRARTPRLLPFPRARG